MAYTLHPDDELAPGATTEPYGCAECGCRWDVTFVPDGAKYPGGPNERFPADDSDTECPRCGEPGETL